MKIDLVQQDDLYAETIKSMFALNFPGSVSNSKILLDVLATELIGTKQHRLGPMPDPETQVSVRTEITKALDEGKPITILTPWGASKQGPFGADIAEVMALKQLVCLRNRIIPHYPIGINVIMRLEDLTDHVLFGLEQKPKVDAYVEQIQVLTKAIAPFVTIKLESSMMDPETFYDTVSRNASVIHRAMSKLDLGERKSLLSEIGWTGTLPEEQLDYYRHIYQKFYPQLSYMQRDIKLATYLGSALAKRDLGGRGASEGVLLSWVPPIPGQSTLKRLYYRTIPERFTNQHKAPWIGKGYIRIKGREATPAIAGWDGDGLEYNQLSVKIGDHEVSTVIDADYVVLE